MECTQPLQCTQDVSSNDRRVESNSPKPSPEQVGFLGICGSTHPIYMGPNRIGRDPETCSIVLNFDTISRKHAIINIWNKKKIMIMDLGSQNKTILSGITLTPYRAVELKNDDTVQFGDQLGIFSTLMEGGNLPMTQVLDIPETPDNIWHGIRLKTGPATTIPESPDVSDRDDSIIGQSQPSKKTIFKNPNNNFFKSSGKIIGIEPIGTNKIDNVYWNSSRKSDSFSNLFEGNSSNIANKDQQTEKISTNDDNIFNMETQPPDDNKTSDSIYEANTQLPSDRASPNIYSYETQVPNIDKMPKVCKVQIQNDIYISRNMIDAKIFDMETQVSVPDKTIKRFSPLLPCPATIGKGGAGCSISNKKLNSSDEEICFDEIDSQPFDDECLSQPLLPSEIGHSENIFISTAIQAKSNDVKSKAPCNIVDDSDSKDSEEIAPSQLVPEKPIPEEDVTDCEDNMIELNLPSSPKINKKQSDDDLTDCEDDLNYDKTLHKVKTADDDDVTDCEDEITEISKNKVKQNNAVQNRLKSDHNTSLSNAIGGELSGNNKCMPANDDVAFEDMLTQVIEESPIEVTTASHIPKEIVEQVPFEDLQTQVIDIIEPQQKIANLTHIGNKSSFKVPLPSPRLKRKDLTSINKSNSTTAVIQAKNEENYYEATQQILNDLCSQNDQNINDISTNLSEEQKQEVTGGDIYVAPLAQKKSGDSSDLEMTPKKFNTSKFLMIDLPSSQDIISSDFVSSKVDSSDSSNGFEDSENHESPKHSSPARFHRKRRKKDIKVDLMKKFDSNTLPTRAITRIRKPTTKILESDDTSRKMCEKILQSNLGLDNTHEINSELLEINLKRLRNKMDRVKMKTDPSGSVLVQDEKNVDKSKERSSRKPGNVKSKNETLHKSNEKKRIQQNIKPMIKEEMMHKDEKVTHVKIESTNISRRSSRKKKEDDSMNDKQKSATKESKSKSRDNKRSSGRNKAKSNKEDDKNGKKKSPAEEENSVNHDSSKRSSHSKHVKNIVDFIEEIREKDPPVRRSKRQATKNENAKEINRNSNQSKQGSKSENGLSDSNSTKRSHMVSNSDKSTVYNLSSDTGVDSPITLKRQATSDIFLSKSKKTKTSAAVSTSLRATPARRVKTQYVLFTAFPNIEVKEKLEKLGAVVVTDVQSCTVVLTLCIKRTFKLLCAVGLGKPIVGPSWVQACADSNMIVDPWLYLIKDEATEKRFGFNLRQSLTCARGFLRGCSVSCTPNVTPSAQEMKSIVECSGGVWKEGGPRWYVVSCSEDKALWAALRRRGAALVSNEFVLGGVLLQRLNVERVRLA